MSELDNPLPSSVDAETIAPAPNERDATSVSGQEGHDSGTVRGQSSIGDAAVAADASFVPLSHGGDVLHPHNPVRSGRPVVTIAASALAGAILAAGGVFYLANAGFIGGHDQSRAIEPVSQLQTQLAQVSQRLDALGKAAGSTHDEQLARLASRISALEATAGSAPVAAVSSGSDPQVAALEDAGKEFAKRLEAHSGEIAAVSARLNSVEAIQKGLSVTAAAATASAGKTSDALVALDQRLTALETRDKVAGEQRQIAAAALAVTALSQAMSTGRGFVHEYRAVQTALPRLDALSAIEPYAARGVPQARDIIRDFPANDILAATDTPAGGGLLDKIAASARTWVHYRSSGGTDAGSAVSAIAELLGKGDLAEAYARWQSLPAAGKAVSQIWAGNLQGRIALDKAANDLADQVAASLGPQVNPGTTGDK